MAGDRELRPSQPGEPLGPGPLDVVTGGVPGVQAGGIHRHLGPGGGQAASVGVGEDGPPEGVEAPFFGSRAAAYAGVESWGPWARPNSRRKSDESAGMAAMAR